MAKSSLALVLIAVLGILIYSNTFNVPFQWDEDISIEENPIVKDLGYFAAPSSAKKFGNLYYSFRDRYVGYLSFALNYRIHGLDVRGYHVVNIALHIFNAMLVYALLRLTLRAIENITPPSPPEIITPPNPPLSLRGGAGGGGVIPLFVSLLFVSHPVQTEAVNYVMGRLPLLMWFFYLSSMVLYATWRLGWERIASSGTPRNDVIASGAKQSNIFLYILSLLSAVLAMKTKENALSLPFSIVLYEFLFFDGAVKKRLLYLAPLLLTLLIIPLSLMSFNRPIAETISVIESASRHYTDIPRTSYLFTQFSVLVTYLRLLFLPVSQNFDYDYPLYESFSEPQVLLFFLSLAAVFSLGVYLVVRSRGGNHALRLMGWGILWFFLTLSVESSFFPIPQIICEYRLYAPSMGIFLAVILVLAYLPPKKLTAAVSVLVIVLSVASYARNSVWRSQITLWEDAVRKSPEKANPYNKLAYAYDAAGLTDKAIENYRTALAIMPDNAKTHNNIGIIYQSKGMTDKAIEHYKAAINLAPDFTQAYNNIGNAYMSKGETDKAIEQYRAAINLAPEFAEAHYNLGFAYHEKGLDAEARVALDTALRIDPDNEAWRHLRQSPYLDQR